MLNIIFTNLVFVRMQENYIDFQTRNEVVISFWYRIEFEVMGILLIYLSKQCHIKL